MAMGSPRDTTGDLDLTEELSGVAAVLKALREGTTNITKDLEAEIKSAQQELFEREEKSRKRLEAEIADMYAKGLIDGQEQAAAYAQNQLDKQLSEKLKREIDILRVLSSESAAQREKEKAYLEKKLQDERELLKLKEIAAKNPSDKGAQKAVENKQREITKDNLKQKTEDNVAKRQQEFRENGGAMDKMLQQMKEDAEFAKTAEGKEAARQEQQAKLLKNVGAAITNGLNAINNAISSYAKYQTAINARLQGVSSYSNVVKTLGSVAFSPLLKAEDLYANLSELVGQGIVTNIEQRAMFATVKDGIAQTFDVTNDSLRRIIRIQQNDSTAARLGMEAYLNKFLNTFVESTEYLQSTFDNVASSLLEASAALSYNNRGGRDNGTAASLEFEATVQKWLGSLVGVGFSDTAAQNIAEALGKLGSGNISVFDEKVGNLMVMAASKMSKDIGTILNEGLDAKTTNDLLSSMVEYLQEIASNSDNNIVRSQLADIFGVSVSDLVSVMNLNQSELSKLNETNLSYSGMYSELINQFKQLPSREGIANILENLFGNFLYQTGMSIGSNPILYTLWKVTDLIQSVTGGIAIPAISVMGSGFDLETTIENLIKIGIVGISTLGNIGNIVSGLASIGNGAVLLNSIGVNEDNAVIKQVGKGEGFGTPSGKRKSGIETSNLEYLGVANSDSDTYADSAVNSASDDAQKKLDKKSEEKEDDSVKPFRKGLEQYFNEEVDLEGKLLQIIDNQEKALILSGALQGSSYDALFAEDIQKYVKDQSILSFIDYNVGLKEELKETVEDMLIKVDYPLFVKLAMKLLGKSDDELYYYKAPNTETGKLAQVVLGSSVDISYEGHELDFEEKAAEATGEAAASAAQAAEAAESAAQSATAAANALPTVGNIGGASNLGGSTGESGVTNLENITTQIEISDENVNLIVTNINNAIAAQTTSIAIYLDTLSSIDLKLNNLDSINTSLSDILIKVSELDFVKDVITGTGISTNSIINNVTGVTNTSNTTSEMNTVEEGGQSTSLSTYNEENGILNSTTTSVEPVSIAGNADIGDYLNGIDFGTGFKSLVVNVEKILKRLDNASENIFNTGGEETITGFTNLSFSEF